MSAMVPAAAAFLRREMLCAAVRPPPGLEDVVPAGLKPPASQCSTDCGSSGGSTAGGLRGAEGAAAVALPPAPPASAEERLARGPKPVLTLAGAVEPGQPGLPSVGSVCHHLGLCKPCDFIHRSSSGCGAGAACKFCHLCGPDENRRRKAMKKGAIRAMRQKPEAPAAGTGRP
mmetsp:Transcript_14331/g.37829  ORF Transcript_14331/g.37829 Transcript_14331/m.37829 type:complete len:173 (+) Transcript_14331:103-621(+)